MNRPYHHGERGLALVAVLWLVAALSLIVTGLVASVRSETRLVSGAREGVVAGAAKFVAATAGATAAGALGFFLALIS